MAAICYVFCYLWFRGCCCFWWLVWFIYLCMRSFANITILTSNLVISPGVIRLKLRHCSARCSSPSAGGKLKPVSGLVSPQSRRGVPTFQGSWRQPTQTTHYEKGNPPKWPYMFIVWTPLNRYFNIPWIIGWWIIPVFAHHNRLKTDQVFRIILCTLYYPPAIKHSWLENHEGRYIYCF